MSDRSPKTADGAGTGVRGTETRRDDPPLDIGTEAIEAARQTGGHEEGTAEDRLDAEHDAPAPRHRRGDQPG